MQSRQSMPLDDPTPTDELARPDDSPSTQKVRRKGLPRWYPLLMIAAAAAVLWFLSPRGAGAPQEAQQPGVGQVLIQSEELPPGMGRGYPVAALPGDLAGQQMPRAGNRAPDFHMQLNDGSYLTLASLQGKPVVINFWASWCGPCRLEMPEFVNAAADHPEMVLLAVNVREDMGTIGTFVNDFGMDMPVVRDPNGSLSDLYGVRGMPTTVFVDRDGNISTIWTGLLNRPKLEELLARIL